MDDRDKVPDLMKHDLPGKTEMLQLDYNVAGLLCYLPIPPINLIASVLWLIKEPTSNTFLRFHAIQGLMLFGAFVIGCFINSFVGMFSAIPLLGWVFGLLGGLLGLVLALGYLAGSIILMVKAYDRQLFKIPYLGDIAESKANS